MEKKFLLILLVLIWSCHTPNRDPKFNRTFTDQQQLNGKWYLHQKIIPKINTRDSIFQIDSTTYQGKRITIDVENMLFSGELYPYNAMVSKYRMVINGDSLKVKSGAIQNGEPIYKNSFTYMLSEDLQYLRIHKIDEKDIEIYHKR
ncbi:MAG: hypothetical protein HOH47_05980 [Flavobacteriaceae bacterium]|nr:hypothetical protein [Flavobacteriaceae bacterium]